MQTKQITQSLYCLNEWEWRLVVQCLKYTQHRLKFHPECGAKYFAQEKDIRKLIKEAEKISLEEVNRRLDKILEV